MSVGVALLSRDQVEQLPGRAREVVEYRKSDRQATERLIQAGFDVLQVEVNQRTPVQAAMFIRNRLMSFFTVGKD